MSNKIIPLTTEMAVRQHTRKVLLEHVKKMLKEEKLDPEAAKKQQKVLQVADLIQKHGPDLIMSQYLSVAKQAMSPALDELLSLITFPVNSDKFFTAYSILYNIMKNDTSDLVYTRTLAALYGEENEDFTEMIASILNPADPINLLFYAMAPFTGGLSLGGLAVKGAVKRAGAEFAEAGAEEILKKSIKQSAKGRKGLKAVDDEVVQARRALKRSVDDVPVGTPGRLRTAVSYIPGVSPPKYLKTTDIAKIRNTMGNEGFKTFDDVLKDMTTRGLDVPSDPARLVSDIFSNPVARAKFKPLLSMSDDAAYDEWVQIIAESPAFRDAFSNYIQTITGKQLLARKLSGLLGKSQQGVELGFNLMKTYNKAVGKKVGRPRVKSPVTVRRSGRSVGPVPIPKFGLQNPLPWRRWSDECAEEIGDIVPGLDVDTVRRVLDSNLKDFVDDGLETLTTNQRTLLNRVFKSESDTALDQSLNLIPADVSKIDELISILKRNDSNAFERSKVADAFGIPTSNINLLITREPAVAREASDVLIEVLKKKKANIEVITRQADEIAEEVVKHHLTEVGAANARRSLVAHLANRTGRFAVMDYFDPIADTSQSTKEPGVQTVQQQKDAELLIAEMEDTELKMESAEELMDDSLLELELDVANLEEDARLDGTSGAPGSAVGFTEEEPFDLAAAAAEAESDQSLLITMLQGYDNWNRFVTSAGMQKAERLAKYFNEWNDEMAGDIWKVTYFKLTNYEMGTVNGKEGVEISAGGMNALVRGLAATLQMVAEKKTSKENALNRMLTGKPAKLSGAQKQALKRICEQSHDSVTRVDFQTLEKAYEVVLNETTSSAPEDVRKELMKAGGKIIQESSNKTSKRDSTLSLKEEDVRRIIREKLKKKDLTQRQSSSILLKEEENLSAGSSGPPEDWLKTQSIIAKILHTSIQSPGIDTFFGSQGLYQILIDEMKKTNQDAGKNDAGVNTFFRILYGGSNIVQGSQERDVSDNTLKDVPKPHTRDIWFAPGMALLEFDKADLISGTNNYRTVYAKVGPQFGVPYVGGCHGRSGGGLGGRYSFSQGVTPNGTLGWTAVVNSVKGALGNADMSRKVKVVMKRFMADVTSNFTAAAGKIYHPVYFAYFSTNNLGIQNWYAKTAKLAMPGDPLGNISRKEPSTILSYFLSETVLPSPSLVVTMDEDIVGFRRSSVANHGFSSSYFDIDGTGTVAKSLFNDPAYNLFYTNFAESLDSGQIEGNKIKPDVVEDEEETGGKEGDKKDDTKTAKEKREKVKQWVKNTAQNNAELEDNDPSDASGGNIFIYEKSMAFYIYRWDLEDEAKSVAPEFFEGMYTPSYGKGNKVNLTLGDVSAVQMRALQKVIIKDAWTREGGQGIFGNSTYRAAIEANPEIKKAVEEGRQWANQGEKPGLGNLLSTIPGLEAYDPSGDRGTKYSPALFFKDLVNNSSEPSQNPMGTRKSKRRRKGSPDPSPSRSPKRTSTNRRMSRSNPKTSSAGQSRIAVSGSTTILDKIIVGGTRALERSMTGLASLSYAIDTNSRGRLKLDYNRKTGKIQSVKNAGSMENLKSVIGTRSTSDAKAWIRSVKNWIQRNTNESEVKNLGPDFWQGDEVYIAVGNTNLGGRPRVMKENSKKPINVSKAFKKKDRNLVDESNLRGLIRSKLVREYKLQAIGDSDLSRIAGTGGSDFKKSGGLDAEDQPAPPDGEVARYNVRYGKALKALEDQGVDTSDIINGTGFVFPVVGPCYNAGYDVGTMGRRGKKGIVKARKD